MSAAVLSVVDKTELADGDYSEGDFLAVQAVEASSRYQCHKSQVWGVSSAVVLAAHDLSSSPVPAGHDEAGPARGHKEALLKQRDDFEADQQPATSCDSPAVRSAVSSRLSEVSHADSCCVRMNC